MIREDARERMIADFERLPAILRMIRYLIDEAREIDPDTAFFLRLAEASLLEREQKAADAAGRN